MRWQCIIFFQKSSFFYLISIHYVHQICILEIIYAKFHCSTLKKCFFNKKNYKKTIYRISKKIVMTYEIFSSRTLCLTIPYCAEATQNKAGYTATEVVCGWVGAVMKHANSSIWTGAVTPKKPENAKNAKKANSGQQTNRPT